MSANVAVAPDKDKFAHMVDHRCDWRAAGRHQRVVCQLRGGGTQHRVSLYYAKERSALAGRPAIFSTIA
eukprot:1476703-Prorocentrum_lima.AAC.1